MTTVRDLVGPVTVSGPVPDLRPRPRRRHRRTTPADVSSVHPLALAWAVELARGDRSRLRFLPDGSVLVSNHRRR